MGNWKKRETNRPWKNWEDGMARGWKSKSGREGENDNGDPLRRYKEEIAGSSCSRCRGEIIRP